MNTKRLGLLYQLVPKAVRVAVLLNPSNATSAEVTLRSVQEAASVNGLQIQVINASTSREIDAAFATLARERPDALFVSGDAFFNTQARAICHLGDAQQGEFPRLIRSVSTWKLAG